MFYFVLFFAQEKKIEREEIVVFMVHEECWFRQLIYSTEIFIYSTLNQFLRAILIMGSDL